MRSRSENNDTSVHAIAGTRVVILGLNLKLKDDESGDSSPSTTVSAKLSGLTVAKDANGADRAASESSLPEKNGQSPSHDMIVGFAIDRRDISSGKSASLNFDGRPIQKFHYGDYTVEPGHQYEY
eukprot:scaffold16992_cov67-Skeletonema_dohrnii-CCMP3373.AAC.1